MNISPEIKNQIPNTQSLFWIGSLISGILLGLSAPGFGTNWVGILAFFPLLAILDQLHKNRLFSLQKRAGLFFAVCWFSGSIAASIGGYWITSSINVFGHIPWFAALLITAVGYGLEVGLQLFVYFGIPLLFIRQRSGWDLIVRLAFVLALDPWYPRLIQWNYGGLTFSKFPWLEQAADILGASGLLLYSAGFSFLLLYWWRWESEGTGNRKSLFKASTIYLILWVFGLGYGAWRTQDLVIQNSKLDSASSVNIQNLVPNFPAKLTVMVIQPNFSLQELASNPELAHSKRQQNFAGLLEDSLKALEQLPENTTTPKLLIWPESVYPDPFFKVAASREKVLSFAEANQTSILLATVVNASVQELPEQWFGPMSHALLQHGLFVCMALSQVTFTLFTRLQMMSSGSHPFYPKLFKVLAWTAVLCPLATMLVLPLHQQRQVMLFLLVVTAIFWLVAGIHNSLRKQRVAMIYLSGMIIYLISALSQILNKTGVFSGALLTDNMQTWGLLVSLVLLLVSLSSRFSAHTRLTLAAQRKALSYEQSAHKSQAQLLELERKINESLERQVVERTLALEGAIKVADLAKSEAEEANLQKARFLAAASHDIRQPLQALSLLSETLLYDCLHQESCHQISEYKVSDFKDYKLSSGRVLADIVYDDGLRFKYPNNPTAYQRRKAVFIACGEFDKAFNTDSRWDNLDKWPW